MAYAGSLLTVNEHSIGPAFTHSTGYSYSGRGAESFALSQEIAAGTITPGVFQSVGAAPITPLEPKFTTWYVTFAASPIVVAYDPTGPDASTLKAIADGKQPIAKLFTLMASSGFRLGRTDPNTDPQGRAFLLMLQLAEKELGVSSSTVDSIIGGPGLGNTAQVYSETSLDAHLQAGQLDAASAYLSQAVAQHLPYITLPGTINQGDPSRATLYASVSITLANGKSAQGTPLVVDVTTITGAQGADLQAAQAFVAYVLSPAGRAIYQQNGYDLVPVKLTGPRSAVPAAIRAELPT